ncbi:uncharacterized protein LOC144909061 [Branchiostoma floridae x Branchiostoma belcheri]
MAHGYMSSGMLPNQYKRLCANAGIGQISDVNLKKSMILYGEVVAEQARASMQDAMDEEIGDQPGRTLSIVTDARHAQRRNSYRSGIMALGQNNHKVLAYAPVTKEEQRSSQKHEMYGTTKLYQQFDELGVQIADHAHDRNHTINKFIKDRPPYADGTRTSNSNDTWHGEKKQICHIHGKVKSFNYNIYSFKSIHVSCCINYWYVMFKIPTHAPQVMF